MNFVNTCDTVKTSSCALMEILYDYVFMPSDFEGLLLLYYMPKWELCEAVFPWAVLMAMFVQKYPICT